jgi:E3 SUMO-protein ligase PIAS1
MTPSSDDDDDDLIEITEPGLLPVKQEPGLPSIALERTPAQSQSREASTPSSVLRMSSKKRPVSQVIDLTESGDEDDSPAPPAKRLAPSLPSRAFPPHDYHNPLASSPLIGDSYPPSN